jgi:pimeloyl-ACP methyl ester carboxylesterase
MRIRYEVEGNGPPLVLQHGLSGFLEMWYEWGHVDALKGDYQLILIDALGHGGSDKPHHPEAYQLERAVSDVVTVLDHLHLSKASFWGYSMGGIFGYGIARFAPERFSVLVIGGAHPYLSRSSGDNQEFVNGMIRSLETGMSEWADGFQYTVEEVEHLPPLSPQFKARMLANDPQALIALLQAEPPSLEAILTANTIPCLIYAGEADDGIYAQAQTCARQMPNATFLSVPGGHVAAYVRFDLLLPHIRKLLAGAAQV